MDVSGQEIGWAGESRTPAVRRPPCLSLTAEDPPPSPQLALLRLVQAGTAQARLEVLQLLSKPGPGLTEMLNAADPVSCRTPLHEVTAAGDGQLTQLLASQPGIDFNALDAAGRTALACLIASGQAQQVAKFLLAASANAAPANGAPLDPALHAPGAPWVSPMALALADPEPDVLRALLHTVKLINRLSAVPGPMLHGGPPFGSPGLGISSSARYERGVILPGVPPPGITPSTDAGPSLACGLPRLLKQPVDELACPPLLSALLQRKLAHASVLVGYGAPLDSVTPDPTSTPPPDVQCSIRLAAGMTMAHESGALPSPSGGSAASSVGDSVSSPTKRAFSASSGSVLSMPGTTGSNASLPSSTCSGDACVPGRTAMHVLIAYIAELEAEQAAAGSTTQQSDMPPLSADHLGSAPTASTVASLRCHSGLSRCSTSSARSIAAALPVSPLAAAYELAAAIARKPAMQQALGIRDAQGNTCLHAAAAAGQVAVVTALLRGVQHSAPAVLRLRNLQQLTALDLARAAGHTAVVQALVDAQAASLAPAHHMHLSPRQHSAPPVMWAPGRSPLGSGRITGTHSTAPASVGGMYTSQVLSAGVGTVVSSTAQSFGSARFPAARRAEVVPEEGEDAPQPVSPPSGPVLEPAASLPAVDTPVVPPLTSVPEPPALGPLMRHLRVLPPAPLAAAVSEPQPLSCVLSDVAVSLARAPPVEVPSTSITPPPASVSHSPVSVCSQPSPAPSKGALGGKKLAWKPKNLGKALRAVFSDA